MKNILVTTLMALCATSIAGHASEPLPRGVKNLTIDRLFPACFGMEFKQNNHAITLSGNTLEVKGLDGESYSYSLSNVSKFKAMNASRKLNVGGKGQASIERMVATLRTPLCEMNLYGQATTVVIPDVAGEKRSVTVFTPIAKSNRLSSIRTYADEKQRRVTDSAAMSETWVDPDLFGSASKLDAIINRGFDECGPGMCANQRILKLQRCQMSWEACTVGVLVAGIITGASCTLAAPVCGGIVAAVISAGTIKCNVDELNCQASAFEAERRCLRDCDGARIR